MEPSADGDSAGAAGPAPGAVMRASPAREGTPMPSASPPSGTPGPSPPPGSATGVREAENLVAALSLQDTTMAEVPGSCDAVLGRVAGAALPQRRGRHCRSRRSAGIADQHRVAGRVTGRAAGR